MYGVSKITSAEDVVLVSFPEILPAQVPGVLSTLAEAGIVVDMISQTAPAGAGVRLGFTTSEENFEPAIQALGTNHPAGVPMISSGFTKINLFGEEMVESVGVAARALAAVVSEEVEVFMVTTSDLDISLLVPREDADVALAALAQVYGL